MSEWSEFQALPGKSGGMAATEVNLEEEKRSRNLSPPFLFPVTKELLSQAAADAKGLKWSFQLSKRRKMVPPWSAPAELWWMMAFPHRISNPRLAPRKTRGVGFVEPDVQETPTFQWCLFSLCVGIRRRHRVPFDWNVSLGCQVPKPGKHAHPQRCARDRLIHILDPVGKGYFAHLVRKRQQGDDAPRHTSMTHGYIKFRCREDAIGAIKVARHRLGASHTSHILELMDLSNAFGSLDYAQMDKALPSFIAPEDIDVAQTRFRDVFVRIDAPDGTLHVRPGCGGLQGDVFMVFLWLSAFAPVVASWQEEQMFAQGDIFARSLLARSPVGKLTDASITVFADDLAKIRILQKPWLPVSATAEEAILCHKTRGIGQP